MRLWNWLARYWNHPDVGIGSVRPEATGWRHDVGVGSVRVEDTGLAPDDVGIGSVGPEDTGLAPDDVGIGSVRPEVAYPRLDRRYAHLAPPQAPEADPNEVADHGDRSILSSVTKELTVR